MLIDVFYLFVFFYTFQILLSMLNSLVFMSFQRIVSLVID